ncbi:MAG: leucine-rich repeat protein, partial [Clostridia bacterium]|nr:leucine-rich repeat protein [Clostridia bacterium]
MKFRRILSLVLALLMVMSTFALGAFADEQTLQDTKSVAIKYGTPVVDGQLDEIWETAVAIDFPYDRNDSSESKLAAALETPVDHWAKALWDDANLYVYIRVYDDSVYVDDAIASYNRDGIEVYFDEANNKAFNNTGLRQPCINPTVDGNGKCNKPAEVSAYKTFINEAEGYYDVEVSLPFNNVDAENGVVIGYDVSINGNSTGADKRDNCWSWNDRTNVSYKYSVYLGNGVLEGKEGEGVEVTKYDVTYDANGGAGAPEAQKKVEGQALTLSDAKPTWPGYTFKGWATSAAGEVAYAAGAQYTEDAPLTLYAVWEFSLDTSNRTLPEGAEKKAEGWVLNRELAETQVKWEIYTLGEDTVLNFTLWPEETEKVATSTIYTVNPENGKDIGYSTFGKQAWAAALTGETDGEGNPVTYRHKITKAVIGDGIKQLTTVFGGMGKVATVEIPATLNNLNGPVFESAGALNSIYVKGNAPVEGHLDLSNMTYIAGYCFDGCKKITSVTLNENFTKDILTETFKATSITEIEIPAGVPSIKNLAFSGVSALTKVIVNGSETVIGDYAFANNTDPTKDGYKNYIGQITIVAPVGSKAEEFCTTHADTGIKFEALTDEPDEPEEPEVNIPEMPDMPVDAATGDFAEKNDLQWTFDATTGLLVIHGTDTVLEMDYNISWNGKHEKDTDGDGTKEVLAALPWVDGTIKQADIKEVVIAAPIVKVGGYMLSYLRNVTKITIPTTLTDLSARGALSYSDSLTTIVVAGNEAEEGVIDLSYVTKIGSYALDDAFKGETVKILTGDIESFSAVKFLQTVASAEIMLKPDTPLDAWATKYKNGDFAENADIGKNLTFTYYSDDEGGDEPIIPEPPVDENIVSGNIIGGW